MALGHPIVVEALRYKTRTWRQSRGDSIFVRNLPGNWDNYAQAICDGLEGIVMEQKQVKLGMVALLPAGKGCERAEVTITTWDGTA